MMQLYKTYNPSFRYNKEILEASLDKLLRRKLPRDKLNLNIEI